MAKRQRTGRRSLARGIFAFFWIVLAGFSGLYLFMLFTDPSALGRPTVQLSAMTGDEAPTGAAPAAPAPPAMPAAPAASANAVDSAEITALKDTIRSLSQQLAALDTRLKPIEKFVGPVAALPPAASVTTSPPAPQALPPDPVAAAPEPEPEPAPVEEPVADETPEPPAPPAAAAAPEPEPEPAPAAQAAPEAEPKPAPTAQAAPEPETPAAPPAVAAAPMENTAEPDSPASGEAPPSPQSSEIAAFDPVELPPTANDGSTRYGIEIGTVTKRDDLRPLWREFLTKHAALVAGLQPRRVLAPDKSWRLIAGPFANAQDAEGACSLFKKADRPCAATVYAGDAL